MFNVEELYQSMFSDKAKEILATSIFVACGMSKNLRDGMVSIPRRASMLAGHAFPVFIDKVLTSQIDFMDINVLPYQYRELTIPKCGYSYIEYHSQRGKFHIKKSDKKSKLPKAAVHRLSNAQSNKFFLDLGDEFIPENTSVPFSMVTYGHKKFDLTYIQIGYPTWDYKDWQQNALWDISDCVSKERAEYIKDTYSEKIEEEFKENIVEEFKLKIK